MEKRPSSKINILRVGDPHAKVNNLEEMKRLFDFVLETARKNEVDRIEILGDLFHTHALLRLEVQEFWTRTLTELSNHFQTVVLVGNHDMSGNYSSTFSALSVFSLLKQKNLTIVENPMALGEFGYVPYTHDSDSFIRSANELADLGAKVLVCHQTLQGSRYESGFYAADGISTEGWSTRFVHIISGHIHSEQAFANVLYPGTARWDSITDANLDKGIWLYVHDDETGAIVSSRKISTETVCTPIKSIQWKEGDVQPEIGAGKVTVELVGSSDWITAAKLQIKGRASIKTKITDTKKLESRKSGQNFEDFIRNIYSTQIDRDALLQCAKELGIV